MSKESLLDHIRCLLPEFDKIDEFEILDQNKNVVGYHSTVYMSGGRAFSGGTSPDLLTARRIAVAECFERALFTKNLQNDSSNQFLTREFPTTSGFAAGFESDKTCLRAICEGLERWAWSKWIDDGFKISEMPKSKLILNSLTEVLTRNFDDFKIYRQHIKLNSIDYGVHLELVFAVFVGFTGDGAYAGSRVTTQDDDGWTHAIIEATRNFENFKFASNQQNSSALSQANIVERRALYFGSHKNDALAQIALATKTDWETPQLRLLKEYDTKIPGVYLWRCLMHNWIGWHLGDEKRFVY